VNNDEFDEEMFKNLKEKIQNRYIIFFRIKKNTDTIISVKLKVYTALENYQIAIHNFLQRL